MLQDFRLAERIVMEGRACVIVVNKWDTVPEKTDKTMRDYDEQARLRLRNLDWASIVFTTATTGQRIPK